MRDTFIRVGREALGLGTADVCPQCGATWVRAAEVTREVIAGAADRYARLLLDGEDQPRDPGVWSPVAYTVHTGDWLRIWAERLVAVADDPRRRLPSIDENVLAAARAYDDMAPAAAVHALRAGARDLLEMDGRTRRVAFDHPDFGAADGEAVLSWLAHEVDHHAWDVARLRGLA